MIMDRVLEFIVLLYYVMFGHFGESLSILTLDDDACHYFLGCHIPLFNVKMLPLNLVDCLYLDCFKMLQSEQN